MYARLLKLRRRVTIFALAFTATIPIAAQEGGGWPREFTGPGGAHVVIFQPQVDDLEGDRLTGRAALSVTLADGDDRVFGTLWFDARIATDRDTRTVAILNTQVPGVHFADATDEDQAALIDLLEREVPKMDLDISLDRLLTSLGVSETRRAAAEILNNDPPEIIFATTPTVLVFIDGEPVLQPIEGTNFRIVVNSPFVIINDPGARRFFLYAGHDIWYQSGLAVGPWRVASRVPETITRLIPEDADSEIDIEGNEPFEPPEIIVRTEAAELIVSDGEPEFQPLAGGKLLFMSNSDSDVVLEIATQRRFVLLSGRWYAATSLEGPWSFVAPDELPESFLAIEAEGDRANLRASVAGTVEAEEAVLDTQIPQTGAIRRDSTIEVEYDGSPQFEDIEGTELQWAVNTGEQVIKSGNGYYAVDAGVWYTATSPSGPWQVATAVPDAIYAQPASSPTYNTTFVHVYDATPTVVYVGHHPGYLWSFHHRGCMFWGTGWHHPAWIGHRHIPRHATWGFHVRWDPFWGWTVGSTWSRGWFTFGMSWSSWGRSSAHRGWVGASNWNAGFRAGYRAGRRSQVPRDRLPRNPNIYNRPRNRERNAEVARASRADAGAGRLAAGDQANNVLADRTGNVYRRSSDGSWQERQQGQWRERDFSDVDRSRTADARAQRSSQPGRTDAGSRTRSGQQPGQLSRSGGTGQSLNRDFNARQRGTQRTQSFNRSGGGSRPSRGGRR